MKYDGILKFKYNWRTYQARVLKNADKYMADGKIHIVAAPGSGKTTLGIELISRLGKNALILSPTITIREQWEDRIREAFLCEGIDSDAYLSQSLKGPKAITMATYQAVYAAMRQLKGEKEKPGEDFLEEEDESAGDGAAAGTGEDYSGFDLVKALKAADIQVLCLDECHHLRSEWWKALEELKKELAPKNTIALTATPPYDSEPAAWKRYIDMCGDIDEEITVPELVKEGSLCPHQDFVYFNYPTKEEEGKIKAFEKKADEYLEKLMSDEILLAAVKSYKGLRGELSADTMLQNPASLSAVLIYLKAKGEPFPGGLQKLLGAAKLPKMSKKWMEHLLQSVLYDDVESYEITEDERESLITRLKAAGLIEKRKVAIAKSAANEKLLINSLGKCKSIKEIVFGEYGNMGDDLRLLVLTDYIRKEYLAKIADSEANPEVMLGVLPFFDMLFRENKKRGSDIRLGVLCGSVVIIPAEAKEDLLEEIKGEGKVAFSSIGNLSEEDYIRVNPKGSGHFLTGAVTRVFEKGRMQVLIGTKSLLGEGWDSPCINSLILASFVGSFMLSNQMRGRAIRTYSKDPDKTSNIWHLVCLHAGKESATEADGGESEDFTMLKRRMEHFTGLHYSEESIESGIGRLDIIEGPFHERKIKQINQEMMALSAQRESLKERWRNALHLYEKMETVSETEVDDDFVSANVLTDAKYMLLLSAIGMTVCMAVGNIISAATGTELLGNLFYSGGILLAGAAVSRFPKLFSLGTPLRRIKAYGKGIRKAIDQMGLFEERANRVEAETVTAYTHAVYLLGGTGRDKALFSKCVDEFFAPIDNQRYILVGEKKKTNQYFAVPECFSKKKEDAQLFAACMTSCIGKYSPVYTRSEAGRKLLLKGRVKAFGNRQERCVSKKKVKGALE